MLCACLCCSLETGPICFPVPWLLGSAVPCTGTLKAPLEQGCSLPFSLGTFFLQGSLAQHCQVMLGSLWAELFMDLPHTVSAFLLSPPAQPEQLQLQRGALVPLRLQMQGVWVVMTSLRLVCLALSFNVTVTGSSVELKVEKATLEIPDTGYFLCLTALKYCMLAQFQAGRLLTLSLMSTILAVWICSSPGWRPLSQGGLGVTPPPAACCWQHFLHGSLSLRVL